jgi:hypothetical protein
MIHHNALPINKSIYTFIKGKRTWCPYGVSSAIKVLSPQALLRHWTDVHHFLTYSLKLTTGQREVVFKLLTLWSHYQKVYPKAEQLCDAPGISKPTFWRTIALLKQRGLLTVCNRYVHRDTAQISNSYILDKLILAIARYLSEKGKQFANAYIQPYLTMNGTDFWTMIYLPGFDLPPPKPAS